MSPTFVRCLRSGLLLIIAGAMPMPAPARAEAASVVLESRAAPRGSAATCREDFEQIAPLYAGGSWLRINNSGGRDTPVSAPSLFWEGLGTDDLPAGWENVAFGAQTGAPLSRAMSAGFTLAGYGETTSSWLLTPEIEFRPGASFSFWTRAAINNVGGWPERLYVRLCTADDCTDVGATPDDAGAFDTTLLTINPELALSNPCYQADPLDCSFYPTNWRQYSVPLPASGRGRVAFHNHYPDTATLWVGNGLAIAIDTVELHGVDRCPLLHDSLFGSGFETATDPGALTQNIDSQTVEAGMSVVCQISADQQIYSRNAWLRRFDLHGEYGLAGRVSIGSVDVGIDTANGSQYIPVRLYAIAHGAELSYANMSLVGQAEMPVDGTDTAVIRNVPATGIIDDAEQQDLVVEVSSEYGEAYRGFFVGMNRAGQTAPTYYSGACLVPAEQEGSPPTPVLDGVVDQTALVSASDGLPFYDDSAAVLMIVHVEERPSGAEPSPGQ